MLSGNFDREMAEATETRYTQSRGKKEQYLGFEQNGSLLTYDKKQHVRVQLPLQSGSRRNHFPPESRMYVRIPENQTI